MTIAYHLTESGRKLAYQHQPGEGVGILFCCGFRSDQHSTKATALSEWCASQNIPLTRFDYHGHGKSEVEFRDFTIGGAIADTLDMLDHIAQGPQILVGSSMGSWLALHAALERKSQVRGLVLIAPAPDFTERLMFKKMTPEQRRELDEEGLIWLHSEFTSTDYPITQNFIHEARSHLLLDDIIGLDIPVHLLHGQEDADVPWETSLLLASRLISQDVTTTLIKDGDHRLNRPADLAMMMEKITTLRDSL